MTYQGDTSGEESHDEEAQGEIILDVAWLIHQARGFYLKNPGLQMPYEDWDNLCEQVDFDEHYERSAKIGQNYLQGLENNIIPAIAAISLGVSTEQLAKTLEHHEVCADFFLRCLFSNNQVEGFEDTPDEATHESLSPWNITREMVNAICLIPGMAQELAKDMLEDVGDYGQNHHLELACLLSDQAFLWPVTRLKAHFLGRLGEYPPDEAKKPSITSILAFKDTIDLNTLSNAQILQMLERSGNLHGDVVSENGFDGDLANSFLREMFAGMFDEDDCKNFSRMIEALNSVEDPGQLEKLNTRIIASLSDAYYQIWFDRLQTMKQMERHLDHQRYAPAIQSMLLKLSVLPVGFADQMRNDTINSILIPSFEEFDQCSDQVFKRLHDEIKDISPADFRKPHFLAISAVVNCWRKPQDLSGVDAQGLLMTALAALDYYRSTTHYNPQGYTTDRHEDLAVASVKDLCGYVARNCDVDYKRFNDLSSTSKTFLAANGFEIKKLPGINRRDKGQLLSDGMGL